MTDDQLQKILQGALSRAGATGPPDAWPRLEARLRAGPTWSLVDAVLVATIVTALLIVPEWMFLLALHL